jgi:hypothetical protein
MQSHEEPEMSENVTPVAPRSNHELARRSSCGIEVVLLWCETTGQITVCVSDRKEGTYFELSPPPELALDAFHHPYSYADRACPCYEDARLAA